MLGLPAASQITYVRPVGGPGDLFMLGLPAASKITYVRPVGGPENTSNIRGKS